VLTVAISETNIFPENGPALNSAQRRAARPAQTKDNGVFPCFRLDDRGMALFDRSAAQWCAAGRPIQDNGVCSFRVEREDTGAVFFLPSAEEGYLKGD
jgi:hypothetical protein